MASGILHRLVAVELNLEPRNPSPAGDQYTLRCKEAGIKIHPARFPAALPDFFIRFLTDPDDLVVDPVCWIKYHGRGRRTAGTQVGSN